MTSFLAQLADYRRAAAADHRVQTTPEGAYQARVATLRTRVASPFHRADVQRALAIGSTTADRLIRDMQLKGAVRSAGVGRGGRYSLWEFAS